MAESNVGVFVDIANLYYCIDKKWPNRRLDFEKLKIKLEEEFKIVRAFAYGTQTNDEANSFKNYLKRIGFDAKYKKSNFSSQGEITRANWDVGLTVDVCRILDRIDSVIICSSNSELIPLLQYVRSKGIRCVVFACGISKILRKHCDEYIEITQDLLYQKDQQNGRTREDEAIGESSKNSRTEESGEESDGTDKDVGGTET